MKPLLDTAGIFTNTNMAGLSFDDRSTLAIDPADYTKEKPPFANMMAIPDEMLTPQFLRVFENKIQDPQKTDDLKEVVAPLKKKYPQMSAMSFLGQVAPNGQTIVMSLPGDQYDKYFHFVRNPDTHEVDVRIMVIQKIDPQTGRKIDPPKMYFNNVELPKVYPDDKVSTRRLPGSPSDRSHQAFNREPVKGCIGCHPVGGVAVVSLKGPIQSLFTDKTGEEVQNDLRAAIEATGTAKPAYAKENIYFAPIGETNPSQRTDDFIRSCAKLNNPKLELNQNQISLLKKSMNCTKCHDDYSLNSIRPSGDGVGELQLAKLFIELRHMPPGSDTPGDSSYLDESLRKILSTCLNEEYYAGTGLSHAKGPGTYLRWLLASTCPARLGTLPPPEGKTGDGTVTPSSVKEGR